ncbi:MAG: type II toxin-antitoxin system RelE/ParE family toxin [Inquilinus limosus]|uniref:Type II toxin-antitoxin system RelE/ParE family toxin n=1 Tax=Inquilinus limosus TaxID=171674 RepID=A0A952KKD6_9PROT|nr:type II toxin-antitoxin system RelE/ParE family toxin [Inquilinus limosus]
MKYQVRFRPRAEADLFDLYRYIASASGRAAALGYIDRIEAACLSLETFPERGARRDDIRPGLRVMGFERRAVIVFQISDDEVVIARVLYGGRDYEWALLGAADD